MNDNFIDKAFDEAKKAYLINDVPVGAVIVKDGKIISSAHNYRKNNNALNHAEILAIKKAEEMIGDWRLYDCEMYVTLEPCPMCAGAILLSTVRSVGVMGDERTYEHPVALRAVTSTDAMPADWAPLPYDFMAHVSNEIINKVRGVNRVCYDISSKPPATIEWE